MSCVFCNKTLLNPIKTCESCVGCYICVIIHDNNYCPKCHNEFETITPISNDVGPFWLYSSKKPDHWWIFDLDLNRDIEDMYQTYTTDNSKYIININISAGNYNLDFESMKQVSVNDNTKTRTLYRLCTKFISYDSIGVFLKNDCKVLGINGKPF